MKTPATLNGWLFALPLAFLSGSLLAQSFPRQDIGWLAWIALTPLLIGLYGRKPLLSFVASFLCGITFYVGIGGWLFEIQGYRFIHHVVFGSYLSCYFGLFGVLYSLISRRLGGAAALLSAPFLWVCHEYVKSNFSFLSFPWGLLAHSQHNYLPVIQITSIVGAYGLGFLIVLVNSAIASVVLALAERFRNGWRPQDTLTAKSAFSIAAVAGLVVSACLVYGQSVLSTEIKGKEFTVSIVQANIEQQKKWDPKFADFIMKTYDDLTIKAAEDKPSLIVWPESATPRAISLDRRLYAQVKKIASRAGAPILLGSSSHEKFKMGMGETIKFRNSVHLIYPDGREEDQRYDKIRLLPFGEYLPTKRFIPWSIIQIPDVVDYLPGKEYTVFNIDDLRFSATLCWENIFPDLVREFVKSGAQFIVNVVNEAWFGKSAAPYQFLSMSIFRAVENRVSIVRCANTGISCFIDPFGRVTARVEDPGGEDLFVRGTLSTTVLANDSKTFYTMHGNVVVMVSAFVSAILFCAALLRPKQRVALSRVPARL